MMPFFAIPIHIIAFIFYCRSKKLRSLAIYATIALAIGVIIPFSFLISWAIMDNADNKEGYEKPNSFKKKFDEDWD